MGLFSTGKGAVTRAARDANAAREGRASNLTSFIDSIFSDPKRESQTQGFMEALRAQLGDTTMRGFTDTSRQNKFATARQGLTGGRVDADRQGRTLEDLFKQQIGDESQVQDAGNQLRTQDLATRQSLINSAYGTADVGQDALRGMIGQQAQNSNYLSALWPQTAMGAGSGIADAFRRRTQNQLTYQGIQNAGGGY